MIYSALIGNPVDHSISPALFEYIAGKSGLEYRHVKIRVEKKELAIALDSLRQLSFVGCNVTLPYKEDAVSLIDKLHESAKACGAVNTIKFRHNRSYGFNTDYSGVEESLNRFKYTVDKEKVAVIFGSGGVARAAIYALKRLGHKNIKVFYRTPADTNTLRLKRQASKLGISMYVYDELEKVLPQAALICNMSSAGMIGQSSSPFDISRLEKIDIQATHYLEAVFNPVKTPLYNHFKRRGLTVIDGLWMMIFQALSAYKIWTEQKPTIDSDDLQNLHKILYRKLES